MTPRRTRGQLRRMTARDRAKRDERNARRGRMVVTTTPTMRVRVRTTTTAALRAQRARIRGIGRA